MSVYADLMDPEVNREELEERSERIRDAKDAWYERGWDDFRPQLDLEEVAGRLDSHGHPALVQAYREGWASAAKDEEQLRA